MNGPTVEEEQFWEAAAGLLALPGISRSMMMGLPCLRQDGTFFAAYDRRSGDLLVKLDHARVDQLVGDLHAHPFAPAGRRFRQWAAISPDLAGTWQALLDEAHEHAVEASPPSR